MLLYSPRPIPLAFCWGSQGDTNFYSIHLFPVCYTIIRYVFTICTVTRKKIQVHIVCLLWKWSSHHYSQIRPANFHTSSSSSESRRQLVERSFNLFSETQKQHVPMGQSLIQNKEKKRIVKITVCLLQSHSQTHTHTRSHTQLEKRRMSKIRALETCFQRMIVMIE